MKKFIYNFLKKVFNRTNFTTNSSESNSNNHKPILINNKKSLTMARKTVITKVLPVNTSEAIIEFPQNRTLIVEQLTGQL